MRAQEIALARSLLDYLNGRNDVNLVGPGDAELRAPTIALRHSEPGVEGGEAVGEAWHHGFGREFLRLAIDGGAGDRSSNT